MKLLSIFVAIVAGILFPQFSRLNFLIFYLIMIILTIGFLKVKWEKDQIKPQNFIVLAANLLIPFAGWAIFTFFGNPELAAVAFITGITPTAGAASVVMGFLGGKVDFVLNCFVITSLSMVIVLPLALPLLNLSTSGASLEVFRVIVGEIGVVILVPFILAWIIKLIWAKANKFSHKLGVFSFSLWVVTIMLVTANASKFLRGLESVPVMKISQIALTSMVICIVNFVLGYLIGGKHYRAEASQSLGQKNTAFTIYIALTFINPMAALGPTFYVIWHNLWNGFQLQWRGNLGETGKKGKK